MTLNDFLLENYSHNHKQCEMKTSRRLRGSASTVLTATVLVNGDCQNSTPCRINTPYPIVYIPFLPDSHADQTPGQIFTHDGSNDAVSGKDVHFGVKKTEK